MAKVIYDRAPFVIRLLWDPIRALDLLDATDRPHWSKILPYSFLLIACAFKGIGAWTKNGAWAFDHWELVILGTLTTSVAGWREFLKSKVLTGTSNVAKTVTHTIAEKVDWVKDKAFQPTRE